MKENNVKIEFDTILEYRDGKVFVEKMNTNTIPAMLAWSLIDALNKTIIEYYEEEKQ
ncbi:hypothetical protein Q3C19_17475 [Bacteroides sp. ET489]|uniref:hypothetical protein n=1 Tax=Bacteroides sp. ET489 TaxID=3057126 RepID=UPI002673F242|nr:hypothetical protein [Bacteroides sp. ET489]MDO3392246.1 hypothetical protein [Bacteroides sp. ET489]